jgi:hypothetical protein
MNSGGKLSSAGANPGAPWCVLVRVWTDHRAGAFHVVADLRMGQPAVRVIEEDGHRDQLYRDQFAVEAEILRDVDPLAWAPVQRRSTHVGERAFG